MKKNKIIYWIATGLLSLMLLMSAGMYVFNHEMVVQEFVKLGYPTYVVYPLALAKLLAVAALLLKKKGVLVEWAYAGLFFDFVLAFFAHYMIGDGEQIPAVVAISILAVSYIYKNKF
ncbi:DoxX family protein [Flavicella sediminum]|uniref:DoxX family protein n=1 Tax=Flavicella sediminum TaxID=2585141 RepID=UPI00111FED6B|nr:DoxX family protein [Flavicella sediminum]